VKHGYQFTEYPGALLKEVIIVSFFKLLFKIPSYLLSKIFYYDELVFLESNELPSVDSKQCEVIQYSDAQLIEGVYMSIGRKGHIDRSIIDCRLKHGLDFYVLSINGQFVASTWVLRNVPRFIDEVAVTIFPDKNFYWIRDIYVINDYRGKNIFSQFIGLIISKHLSDKGFKLISDVSRSNTSSMRAHLKLGFKEIMNIRYVILFGVILLRIYKKNASIVEYKPHQRLFFMGYKFKQFIKNNIA